MFDLLIGDLSPTVVDAVEHVAVGGRPEMLPRGVSVGTPVVSPFDPAAEVRAELSDTLECLRRAAWAPQALGSGKSLRELLRGRSDVPAVMEEVTKAIASCVEEAHPGALARLGHDALAELASWPEVQVEWVPDADVGDGCSVAGSYRSDSSPPALCIALSASPGRRQFTALHEVGHHIQQNNIELGAALIMAADAEGLEEGACNLFAGQTLLPAEMVDRYIGARGPSAAEVAELFAGSQASRAPAASGPPNGSAAQAPWWCSTTNYSP